MASFGKPDVKTSPSRSSVRTPGTPDATRRMMPRQTVASAARAARYTNRNVVSPDTNSKLPTNRNASSRSPSKVNMHAASKPNVRSPSRTDFVSESKSDVNNVKTPNHANTNEFFTESTLKNSEVYVIQHNNCDSEPAAILPSGDGEQTNEAPTVADAATPVNSRPATPVPKNKSDSPSRPVTPSDPGSRSRPVTPRPATPNKPLTASRPATPKRPVTPSKPVNSSRPATPARPVTPGRPITPIKAGGTPTARSSSRPTTPAQQTRMGGKPSTPVTAARKGLNANSLTRKPNSTAPTQQPPLQSATPIPATLQTPAQDDSVCSMSVKDEIDIRKEFLEKQEQFLQIRKELDIKQRAALEFYANFQSLNEQLEKERAPEYKEFDPEDMVVLNVGNWSSEEIAKLCRDAIAPLVSENTLDVVKEMNVDDTAFNELNKEICSIPNKFADLCLQAFTSRQEMIDWIKDLMSNMEGSGQSVEKILQMNNQGWQLCENLKALKSEADETVTAVVQISRDALKERSALLTVGESLLREITRLRVEIEAKSSVVETPSTQEDIDMREAVRQLEEERTARNNEKSRATLLESQLRQTRSRVSKMDRQLREAEATIVSLTSSVKTLEDQSRQREVQLETRARKLKESLKTGEVTNNQLLQQRDALQKEVNDLKEQLKTMTNENKRAVAAMNKEVDELKASLKEYQEQKQADAEKIATLEQVVAENKVSMEEMRLKLPEPLELPTEREIDLWAELQSTKETLRLTEDEVIACKREKVRFLETLTKISESENKVGMQQKLAAELLNKEEIIGKMQTQIRELTKSIKLTEQKLCQYEQYVKDVQSYKRSLANRQDAPSGVSYEDLQQEIMDLRMNLLDAMHRNEEMAEQLSQKEQLLEQQDKTSRAQARIIKVREELINMLKNKEMEQSKELGALQQDLEQRMKVVDEVNKQIATKAEEIQELFCTLECKQQQIHRLEKIVLALEEQQRRAQAQRTRHEEKIAALERELAANNRRERKFIFF